MLFAQLKTKNIQQNQDVKLRNDKAHYWYIEQFLSSPKDNTLLSDNANSIRHLNKKRFEDTKPIFK